MKNKMLTAVIFTYNHKASISRCIDSVLNQKTNYPYVIHIWDDASIDGTSDICREYAAKYPEKIVLHVQKENTFLGPYMKMQSYDAICHIDTKYFCIIDGDDYWCNESKIQLALDFLENNPEYIGWAHDTEIITLFGKSSYIHDDLKLNPQNPITLSADAPFFLTSSRVFRTCDYKEKHILPIDYLFYYYHLSKGPIYYHDDIMATYVLGAQSTFANNFDKNLNSMFAYKLSKLFDFKQDEFCTERLKLYDVTNKVGLKNYNKLLFLKKLFGVRYGWHVWFFLTFVPRYGLDSMNINFVYRSRARTKNNSDDYLKFIKDYQIPDEDINLPVVSLTYKLMKKYKKYKKLTNLLIVLLILIVLINVVTMVLFINGVQLL